MPDKFDPTPSRMEGGSKSKNGFLAAMRRLRRARVHRPSAPSITNHQRSTQLDGGAGDAVADAAALSSESPDLVSLPKDGPLCPEPPDSPFRDPFEIPGVSPRIYVYPHSASQIDSTFCERFREVQNYFRLNTEQHPDLKAHVEHIDYGLKLCGASADQAHPSILVFCRPSEFKQLRALLGEKHLKAQYWRRKSTPRYPPAAWGKTPGYPSSGQNTRANKPLFDLYFWRAARPRNLHCVERIPVVLSSGGGGDVMSTLTMSSTVVTTQSEGGGLFSSTIGCAIEVDSVVYGLTAAHAFRSGCSRNPPRSLTPGSDSITHEKTHSNGFQIIQPRILTDLFASELDTEDLLDGDENDFLDDVEYDDMTDDDVDTVHFSRGAYTTQSNTPISAAGATENICSRIDRTGILPMAQHPGEGSNISDNDWALVTLEEDEQLRPNVVVDGVMGATRLIYFSAAADGLPECETKVFISTPSQGTLRGILQPLPSFVGGITRSAPAEYWSVILEGGRNIQPGDSGSIVIGIATSSVYGHVVASNPLGEIYVSPLPATMKQIKKVLFAIRVDLPDPLLRLTRLVNADLFNRREFAMDHLAQLDDLVASERARDASRIYCWEQSSDRKRLAELAAAALPSLHNVWQIQLVQRFAVQPPVAPLQLAVAEHTNTADSGLISIGETGASTVTNDVYFGLQNSLDDSDASDDAQDDEGRSTIFDNDDDLGTARPRRTSMEEDMVYRDLLISRPTNPPSYDTAIKLHARKNDQHAYPFCVIADTPPRYSCDINLEGVFMRKMEVEETVKRPKFRNWQMVYMTLHGTALNVYTVKKQRGWWSLKEPHAPDISPDRPPWAKKGTLERPYSLIHADVGIAADYRRRRYVIRLRLETDQFLLSCVELGTFIKWLDGLYAAINIAAPIDEREFPRDQSIPRIQRIRWLRGQRPVQPPDGHLVYPRRLAERGLEIGSRSQSSLVDVAHPMIPREDDRLVASAPNTHPSRARLEQPPSRPRQTHSITSYYQNENLDPDTNKWRPRHKWTPTHDQLYAKLCYTVLLFKSPRKSNYVVSGGRRWYVDWDSGRMIRVLPPAYGEWDNSGPWRVIEQTNRRL